MKIVRVKFREGDDCFRKLSGLSGKRLKNGKWKLKSYFGVIKKTRLELVFFFFFNLKFGSAHILKGLF